MSTGNGNLDPESNVNVVEPLLTTDGGAVAIIDNEVGGTTMDVANTQYPEEEIVFDNDDDYADGPNSNPSNPRLRIVVNPYSDLEWLGLGVGVFAFFYIVPYIILNALDLSYRLGIVIYYPLGIGYILILHQKLDRKDKFRNHTIIKFIDQKDYLCIGFLVGLLCIYAVDHRTHGKFFNWLSEIFGSQDKANPILFYTWNIMLLLIIVSFMALSSASVVLLASRKTFITLRLARTMQHGQERTLMLVKGGTIVALSVALLTLSREKYREGEYEGPPFGSVFLGTCQACLLASSVAAVFAGVKHIRNNDWTIPSSLRSYFEERVSSRAPGTAE